MRVRRTTIRHKLSTASVAAPARCKAPPTQLHVPIIRHARARNATVQVRPQASSPAKPSLSQRRDHSTSVCDAAAAPHTPGCYSCISAAARKLVLLVHWLAGEKNTSVHRSEILRTHFPPDFTQMVEALSSEWTELRLFATLTPAPQAANGSEETHGVGGVGRQVRHTHPCACLLLCAQTSNQHALSLRS